MKIIRTIITVFLILISSVAFAGPTGYHVTGAGTGWFASNNGYIITNGHVAAYSTDVNVIIQLSKTTFVWGKIVYISPDKDVAILKINKQSPCLPISSQVLKQGDTVVVSKFIITPDEPFDQVVDRYDLDVFDRVIDGIVDTMTVTGYHVIYHDVYQIPPSGTHGNSGSPVLNENQSAVIGIYFGSNPTAGAVLPSKDILTTIEESNTPIVCSNPTSDTKSIMVKVLTVSNKPYNKQDA